MNLLIWRLSSAGSLTNQMELVLIIGWFRILKLSNFITIIELKIWQ
jgi:hypothetical protein